LSGRDSEIQYSGAGSADVLDRRVFAGGKGDSVADLNSRIGAVRAWSAGVALFRGRILKLPDTGREFPKHPRGSIGFQREVAFLANLAAALQCIRASADMQVCWLDRAAMRDSVLAFESRRERVKKLNLVLAALVAMSFVAPSIAEARSRRDEHHVDRRHHDGHHRKPSLLKRILH
jgi:hypothetical protein